MNTSLPRLAGMVLLATLSAAASASAQPVVQLHQGEELPLTPRQPSGYLVALGTYFTIEGVLYDGGGKVESNTLVVEIVDGKRLDKPIQILVKNARIPPKVRCVLKGYELGEMIGRPPAEYDLT